MCWAHCRPNVRVTGLVRLELTRPTASRALLKMGAAQGPTPELVTWGGGYATGREGARAVCFQRPFRCPFGPGMVHAEPGKVRDRDSGSPNHSGQVSRAPPLSLECTSLRPRRPTPQSQPQSSQAESSLSLGGGNRMWGGGPHPSCLGGGLVLPPPFSSCELAGAGLVPRALPYKAKKMLESGSD